MYKSDDMRTEEACGQCVGMVAVVTILTVWTNRTLDYWFTEWKGEPVDINWLWSLLLSVVGAPIVFVGNILSEIARATL